MHACLLTHTPYIPARRMWRRMKYFYHLSKCPQKEVRRSISRICHCDLDKLDSLLSSKGHQFKKNLDIFGMVKPLFHCCVRLLCAGSLDQDKKKTVTENVWKKIFSIFHHIKLSIKGWCNFMFRIQGLGWWGWECQRAPITSPAI